MVLRSFAEFRLCREGGGARGRHKDRVVEIEVMGKGGGRGCGGGRGRALDDVGRGDGEAGFKLVFWDVEEAELVVVRLQGDWTWNSRRRRWREEVGLRLIVAVGDLIAFGRTRDGGGGRRKRRG